MSQSGERPHNSEFSIIPHHWTFDEKNNPSLHIQQIGENWISIEAFESEDNLKILADYLFDNEGQPFEMRHRMMDSDPATGYSYVIDLSGDIASQFQIDQGPNQNSLGVGFYTEGDNPTIKTRHVAAVVFQDGQLDHINIKNPFVQFPDIVQFPDVTLVSSTLRKNLDEQTAEDQQNIIASIQNSIYSPTEPWAIEPINNGFRLNQTNRTDQHFELRWISHDTFVNILCTDSISGITQTITVPFEADMERIITVADAPIDSTNSENKFPWKGLPDELGVQLSYTIPPEYFRSKKIPS